MLLKDTQIRNARPRNKPYRQRDGGGLYLEVKPSGSKLWRYRYRLAGKENMYAIGQYPEVGIKSARAERDRAKKLIKEGKNPSHQRKLDRIRHTNEHANTFEAVAREWLNNNAGRWTSRTYQQRKNALERDVFPHIGKLPVRQVIPFHVLDILKRTEKRAPSMAVIVNQMIGAVCRYAVATLRSDSDPTHPLRGSLKSRQVHHHKPLAANDLPDFIRAIDNHPGYFSNKIALHLMLLTLVRTTEMLEATWDEFDFEQRLWVIPAERMKMREPHTVPLSIQAIEVLKRLHTVTGKGKYLFPNRSNLHKSVSQGVLWKMVNSMGYKGKFSPHGIRSTGSTILNEMGFRPDVIERQLAHKERNNVRASYNRAEYLTERHKMMQEWADFIDAKQTEQDVIPIRSRDNTYRPYG